MTIVPQTPTQRRNKRWITVSLMPAVVIFALLSAFPVFNLIGLSLFKVSWQDGKAVYDFVGLSNYDYLFTEEEIYWAGVRNTLIFAVTVVTFQMMLGFTMALAVMRAGSVGRSLLTGVFLLPIVIPPIVIGTMWRLILGREFGLFNQILGFVGAGPVDWLGNPDIALGTIMFVDIWHWTPFVFLLMLAGLESLDQEVLEAARIDVRSFWQELRHVVIPMMLPTIVITMVFRIILSFKVFDEVYLLTSGGPGTATEVVNFSIYRVFFAEDRVGDGAAMSLVTLVAVAGMIVLANLAIKLARRSDNKSGEAS
ncbi:MAG: sugar ABC transporter permease [Rhodobacteraceae bacterium]|nr:sugar ABC transporter permease [Paracoccaceae bacterium]